MKSKITYAISVEIPGALQDLFPENSKLALSINYGSARSNGKKFGASKYTGSMKISVVEDGTLGEDLLVLDKFGFNDPADVASDADFLTQQLYELAHEYLKTHPQKPVFEQPAQ